eukprot:CAMPEP_0172470754 /NCGR_PEP_ID=MMETSP1065-20121228/67195_1 /TAXON_ID=265537 /ORGANISM="Amphiprora paludosa, Strain CCMP125" /LENGTH=43 /DNA_ID= /DNA_START= /DNA_END= /DNA_ORIENTATION=
MIIPKQPKAKRNVDGNDEVGDDAVADDDDDVDAILLFGSVLLG